MIDNKIILFESFPNFSGSPLEIYNELKRRGYDKKYELVWASDNTAFEGDYKTVNYFGKNANKSSILDKTKIIIDSNNYIYKKQNNFRLHVRHGCSVHILMRKNMPEPMKTFYPSRPSRNKCKYIRLKWNDAKIEVFIHDKVSK